MSGMTLFEGNNSLISKSMLDSLNSVNNNLVGGSFGTNRRISIRGGKFRQILNGEQLEVSTDNEMHIVVIDAAPIARTYYEDSYSPDSTVGPKCWSRDCEAPASDVEAPMSNSCQTCDMNVKGSGAGMSRACRFSQRIAVAIDGDFNTVYQLSLPATSLFGDKSGDNMPMQAYARYLRAHETPAIAIVTAMSFDVDSDVPKLFFKPVRPLTEEELTQVLELKETEETKNAITFTVYQMDSESDSKAEKAPNGKKAASKKAKKVVEEPTKAAKKKATSEPAKDESLDSMIAEWDD